MTKKKTMEACASSALPKQGDGERNEPCYEFDWRELFERLGERDLAAELAEEDFTGMAKGLHAIFDWVLAVNLNGKDVQRIVGRRLIALAWTVDPSRFDNASVRKLAEQLGLTAPGLSKLSAAASRRFKIQNRFQDHDWRKGK